MSTPVVTPDPAMPPLVTPDPSKTTEAVVAALSVLIPAILVIFKLHVSDTVIAASITLLGAVFSAFTFIHAKGVRSARAIGRGLALSKSANLSIRP